MAEVADTPDKFLDTNGLSELSSKVKTEIMEKAELQHSIKVKNPRVKVDGWEHDKTIDVTQFKTLDDVMNYMFRNVIAEADPSTPYVLPTCSIKFKEGESATIEVGATKTIHLEKNSFNQGTIGTCKGPWEGEPNQTSVASGSTGANAADYVVCDCGASSDVPDPSVWVSIGDVSETLTAGTSTVSSHYYRGKCDYTKSTATSYSSYGKVRHITGVSEFPAGTTEPSDAIQFKVYGYYPAFGNVSSVEVGYKDTPVDKIKTTDMSDIDYKSTISNLGNTMNENAGVYEFKMGGINTITGHNDNIFLYIPATLKVSKLHYWDTQLGKWAPETDAGVSAVESDGHFADIPAGTNKSKFPNGSLTTGVEYRLVKLPVGMQQKSSVWRIKLVNKQ